jgi:hypothetical protein
MLWYLFTFRIISIIYILALVITIYIDTLFIIDLKICFLSTTHHTWHVAHALPSFEDVIVLSLNAGPLL